MPLIRDFNGNGYNDLFLVTDQQMLVYHGGPNGINLVQTLDNAGAGAEAIDLDQDGHLDVVALDVNSATGNKIQTFLNNGGGTFTFAQELPTTQSGWMAAVGDLDNDGILDLAVSTRVSPVLRVFLGDGQGGFKSSLEYNLARRQ